MRCTIAGCPDEYEKRQITHAVRHRGGVVVIDHVPARICSVRGDVSFTPETVRRGEAVLETARTPTRIVAVYEYSRR